MAKSKIVKATGAAVGRNGEASDTSRRIEAAMIAAVEKASADGITDPDKVRELMLAARDNALNGE
jgi:hypothetical protein